MITTRCLFIFGQWHYLYLKGYTYMYICIYVRKSIRLWFFSKVFNCLLNLPLWHSDVFYIFFYNSSIVVHFYEWKGMLRKTFKMVRTDNFCWKMKEKKKYVHLNMARTFQECEAMKCQGRAACDISPIPVSSTKEATVKSFLLFLPRSKLCVCQDGILHIFYSTLL